jgi:DNA polymerase delta subunit 1
VGDRVSYVMVKKTKNAKGYEKSEDPLVALKNNIPIDY